MLQPSSQHTSLMILKHWLELRFCLLCVTSAAAAAVASALCTSSIIPAPYKYTPWMKQEVQLWLSNRPMLYTSYSQHCIWHPQWGGSPREIGFIFGTGKLEWLGCSLAKIAWWATQSLGHNTSTWQTHRQPRRHSKCRLTHCVWRQKLQSVLSEPRGRADRRLSSPQQDTRDHGASAVSGASVYFPAVRPVLSGGFSSERKRESIDVKETFK